jgi:peptidyl-dipeptidase A
MTPLRGWFALAACVALALSIGCSKKHDSAANTAADNAASARSEDADAFIARVNRTFLAEHAELQSAQWLAATDINDDSQRLAAKANERHLGQLNAFIEESRRFDGQTLKPETARAIQLLRLSTAMPAPNDPAKLAELTAIAARMKAMYGAGTYCRQGDKTQCRQLDGLEAVLKTSRDYDEQLDAWTGWHATTMPMRKDYARFVELVNEGAKQMGFANAGEMWRAGYDMSPAEFQTQTDRLWGQVKPLYDQLQCYTRVRLVKKYGARGQIDGMIPAHLTGNMWAQSWGNLWDLLAPYPQASPLDIGATLLAERNAEYNKLLAAHAGESNAPPLTPLEQVEIARQADLAEAQSMAHRAESFYVGLGMQKLPESFWTHAQFIKPRDRDVVCHASAWDMDAKGDVRVKMCIRPIAEDFDAIYHELGHVYYYLAYNALPLLFQTGANDGFHEAIGDTIVLSMTPQYLHGIGLVGTQTENREATINAQMRMALEKVAFLPFGLMIDRWRWGVFDGSIKPADYNKAWWALRAKYQGIAPPTPRGEQFFDPGAKYHVPANTPYTRYFLADILQFQFYRALCKAAGNTGPLNECSFAGNAAAGKLYLSMLRKGASQPWQKTLRQFTGDDTIDAGAMLEYFAPLQAWLEEQNKDQQCGWEGNFASAPATEKAQ